VDVLRVESGEEEGRPRARRRRDLSAISMALRFEDLGWRCCVRSCARVLSRELGLRFGGYGEKRDSCALLCESGVCRGETCILLCRE
jgi:hypothetical protein